MPFLPSMQAAFGELRRLWFAPIRQTPRVSVCASSNINCEDNPKQRGRSFLRYEYSAVLVLFCCSAAVAGNTPLLGLPPVANPAAYSPDPKEVALGRRLFFDTRLSRDGSVSCATCHQPAHAFTDARAMARGVELQSGSRNTPTLLNAFFASSQFWDGRATSLANQALRPFINPLEHGLKNESDLLTKIGDDAEYRQDFCAVYGVEGAPIRTARIVHAIAAFESTLIVGDSPFDRYFFGHNSRALTYGAQRGLALFQGRAQCSGCHLIGKGFALFTDNSFHNEHIGLPKVAPHLARIASEFESHRLAGRNVDTLIAADPETAELGRFVVTERPVDIGSFRTPSLRNVALTAPYMHDGSIASLEAAVDHELYARGVQEGRRLVLTPDEKADLVEFLKSLTSSASALKTIIDTGSLNVVSMRGATLK